MSQARSVSATTIRVASLATASLLATAAASTAHASLLDEPPRTITFKLDSPVSPRLNLLRPFQQADVERPGPVGLYTSGRWGRWYERAWMQLAWSGASLAPTDANEDASAWPDGAQLSAPDAAAYAEPSPVDRARAYAEAALKLARDGSPSWLDHLGDEPLPPLFASTGRSLKSNGFDGLFDTPKKVIPWWERCWRRPVTFARYGGEITAFPLVGCDGAIANGAYERLAIVARPPEIASPGDELPDEPDPEAWKQGEWITGVHLMHPRLLWLLQRIADAFPWRQIYVYSGYRPKVAAIPRSHHSLHGEGRAMDIQILGVPNEALFSFCRKLDDAGCGYYPNSKFVHVDVRRPGTGHAFWVDISGPGEPSQYVDAWPGVVDRGGLAWEPPADRIYDQ